MKVNLICRGLSCNESTQQYIERRAQYALGRFGNAIREVSIRLLDENGPRGGIDKLCRILLSPRQGSLIVVEGRGDEIHALADQTLQRVGRAMSRNLKRDRVQRVAIS